MIFKANSEVSSSGFGVPVVGLLEDEEEVDDG
jgi:hypothetical protein